MGKNKGKTEKMIAITMNGSNKVFLLANLDIVQKLNFSKNTHLELMMK